MRKIIATNFIPFELKNTIKPIKDYKPLRTLTWRYATNFIHFELKNTIKWIKGYKIVGTFHDSELEIVDKHKIELTLLIFAFERAALAVFQGFIWLIFNLMYVYTCEN